MYPLEKVFDEVTYEVAEHEAYPALELHL